MQPGLSPDQQHHGRVAGHGEDVDEHHQAEQEQVCLALVKKAGEDKAWDGGEVPGSSACLLQCLPVRGKGASSSRTQQAPSLREGKVEVKVAGQHGSPRGQEKVFTGSWTQGVSIVWVDTPSQWKMTTKGPALGQSSVQRETLAPHVHSGRKEMLKTSDVSIHLRESGEGQHVTVPHV